MTVPPPDELPARQQLEAQLRSLAPRGWSWATDERKRDDTDRTLVQLLQRRIIPGRFGSTAAHRIAFTCTVTVPQTDLAAAEAQLDEDVIAFLYAVTNAHIQWTDAAKSIYDGRLGYQFELELQSKDNRGKE